MEIILKQIFTVLHVLGAVIGAGAAFVSDVTFLKSIRNKNVDKLEFSFLDLFGKMVWAGILLIVISGVGLFTLDPERLIGSSKFLAKMTIVAVIVLNGIAFHFLHIPYIKKSFKKDLFDNLPKNEGAILALSGAVSVVSWFSALVLGSLRGLNLSYLEIISIYILLLSFGAVGAFLTLKRMLQAHDVYFAKKIVGIFFVFSVLFSGTVFYINQSTVTSISTTGTTDTKTNNKGYSFEEVSKHNTDSDCFIVVDNFVFDVTPFVKLHSSAFNCGADVSVNYHKNHGKQIRQQMLQFKIGVLEGVGESAHADDLPIENLTINPKTELFTAVGSWNVLDLMIVVERDRQSLLIVDSAKHKSVGRIENVGYQPHTNVFSSDGNYNFLISRDGWVTKTNLKTLQTEKHIRVGKNSRGTALTDDGKYLVIGNYEPGNIVILDAKNLKVLKEIPLKTTVNGEEIESRAGALVEKGSQVFIALKDSNSVWVLETKGGDIKIIKKFENVGGVASVLHDAYLTPDGKFFIVAAQDANVVWVLDTVDLKEVARVTTGKTPHTGPGATWKNITFVPALGEGLITAIDTNTWKPLKYIKTGGPGLFVRHSPNEDYPYVWADTAFGDFEDEIYVIDARSLEIVKTLVPMDGKRSIHPEFTRDGKYVYVIVWGGDKIFVYNSKTFEVVATIDATTPSLISNVGARLKEPGI